MPPIRPAARLVHQPTSCRQRALRLRGTCSRTASIMLPTRTFAARLFASRPSKAWASASCANTSGPLQAEHAKRKSPCPHALHQAHGNRIIRRLDRDVFPSIDDRPVAELHARHAPPETADMVFLTGGETAAAANRRTGHLVRRGFFRSRSLDASAPHRMMNGASGTATNRQHPTQCYQTQCGSYRG